ncbi:histidine phosphatase family protein [Actinokineospora globicatena]|uniref:histidine phosphatase family protein n=1 Tax=Actinokineospora globicatena TaxID=103729 RepID=UPI0020A274FE|nr:histidine phosphatase family protein [Actinokineospora globicatena]MCP2304882.1 Broad specificity phosphatase PhoE [Actinokineospora globicatena]GLW77737.1 phosphoglycerate mutase [Actinokineospora globicatena]GLW85594.1 phosphoglycerate mutase [Actinokineospora globicatena]
MSSLRVVLVCHGATRATRSAGFPLDEPLLPTAITGAGPGFGHVDSALRGPTLRCLQTAEALGLDAEPDERLRDLDHGDWSGRALDEVAAADPAGMARWLTDPESAPHGGESLAELARRVGGWLDDRSPGAARTVAVTHPAVVRAAIGHALGAGPAAFWRVDVAPLSRTTLRGGPGRWTLRWIVRGTG